MSAFDYLQMWQWADGNAGATEEGVEYLTRQNEPRASQTWDAFLADGPPADVGMPASIADQIRAFKRERLRVWNWEFPEWFNAKYDATASPVGVTYGCEIQGPFCGYDEVGTQTWEEVLQNGPPTNIHMPDDIAESIRSFAIARKR